MRSRWLLALLLLTALVRVPALLSRPMFTDETPILKSVAHMVSERTLVPDHFSYPPLFTYLSVPAIGGASVLGGAGNGMNPGDWAWLDGMTGARGLLLGPRALSLALSLLGIWVIWQATRALPLASRLAGACLLALSPEAIRYGAMALPDIGAGVFAGMALWLAWRYSSHQWPGLLALAGAMAGVSAAFKYNGGLAVAGIIAGALISGNRRQGVRDLVLAGLGSITIFLILTPTWLMVPQQAWQGLLFEMHNVRTERPGEPGGNPFTLLMNAGAVEPGWFMALALGLVVLARTEQARRAMWVWGIPVLLNGVAVASWGKQDANYLLPTIVAASVLLSFALSAAPRVRLAAWGAGFILMAGHVAQWPLPPWADSEALRLLRQQPLDNATVIRFGPQTPKVWSETEITELRESRVGQKYPGVVERRIYGLPVAQEVSAWTGEPSILPDAGATYVLASRRYVARLNRAAQSGSLPMTYADARLASKLATNDGWRKVGETHRGGEGWAYNLYRREQ